MVAFKPRGDKSKRQLVVDLIADRPHDSVITYEELVEATGIKSRSHVQSTVHAAMAALANDHHRLLASVQNVGYRIVRPEEHVQVAASMQRKAGKQIATAQLAVQTVDLSKLPEEGRNLAMAAAAVLRYQADTIRRLDLRQEDLARVLDSVTTKVEKTEEGVVEHDRRLAQLEERLAALEK